MRARSPAEERDLAARLVPRPTQRPEFTIVPENLREEAARGADQCKRDVQTAAALAVVLGWLAGRQKR